MSDDHTDVRKLAEPVFAEVQIQRAARVAGIPLLVRSGSMCRRAASSVVLIR